MNYYIISTLYTNYIVKLINNTLIEGCTEAPSTLLGMLPNTAMQIVSRTRTFRENRVFRVISLISESEIIRKKSIYNDYNELTR